MKLDDYIDINVDADKKRRIAEEKSYEILNYIDEFKNRFEDVTKGKSNFGSTSPSVFVGRTNYPDVSTGILSPVGKENKASDFSAGKKWYNLSIEKILEYRTQILNSNVDSFRSKKNNLVDVQKEVAMAKEPVDVEVKLAKRPKLDFDVDQIRTPMGPTAKAESAELAENPSIPQDVEKVYYDNEWKAENAVFYLYDNGFDVYDIKDIFSMGILGKKKNRRLVPTRWSITAIDDIIASNLYQNIINNPSIDKTRVYKNKFIGNRYWIILSPGSWEFEFVEIKMPGSVWNPHKEIWMESKYEGSKRRTSYSKEVDGAYHAARLGVLEQLEKENKKAKCLIIREVLSDYWAPVGVWQIRESIRNSFDDFGKTDSIEKAIQKVITELPVSKKEIKKKSNLIGSVQSSLRDF